MSGADHLSVKFFRSLLHQLIYGFDGRWITQGLPNNEKHSSQNEVLRLIPFRVAMHDT
jgi:hypothetical protein